MQKTSYIFLILLCLLSCKKKEMIHVSAVNPVTGEMYAGLRFTITEEKTGNQEIYKTVAKGTLNANGTALVSLRLKNRSYLINIEKPINNCYLEPQDITFDKSYSSFDFKFELAPCAFMKLKIKNVNCIDETDKMLLFREHTIPNYYSNNGWLHSGCANWETTGFSDLPMGEIRYKWEVTRNNITEIFYDTVYLNAGEYKTFEINY